MTARLDGEFVVFLIGMRINRYWKLHKWLPVATAMPQYETIYNNMPPYGLGRVGQLVPATGSLESAGERLR
jgi:hypothetical protein